MAILKAGLGERLHSARLVRPEDGVFGAVVPQPLRKRGRMCPPVRDAPNMRCRIVPAAVKCRFSPCGPFAWLAA